MLTAARLRPPRLQQAANIRAVGIGKNMPNPYLPWGCPLSMKVSYRTSHLRLGLP